jgi:hypothetical protein
MLNVIMLSLIALIVIMLSVVLPEKELKSQQRQERKEAQSFERIITTLNDLKIANRSCFQCNNKQF